MPYEVVGIFKGLQLTSPVQLLPGRVCIVDMPALVGQSDETESLFLGFLKEDLFYFLLIIFRRFLFFCILLSCCVVLS